MVLKLSSLAAACSLAAALTLFAPVPVGLGPQPALAGSYAFKLNGGTVTLAIPDGWKVSTVKSGIQVSRADQEVLVWFQAATPDTIGKLMDEYKTYFTQQGVSFTGEPKSEEHDMGSATALDMRFDAKWKGAPTVVAITVVNRKGNPSGTVLVGYWASPKADKESDPLMNQLIGSLIAP